MCKKGKADIPGKTPPVICVTSRKLCTGDFLTQVEKIAEAGFPAIILREKDLQEQEYKELAGKFLDICRRYGTKGILHTYGECARSLGADAVHFSMEGFRGWAGRYPQKLFSLTGVSVHSAEEAWEAERLGADYLTAGHIFETDCKRGLPGRGLDFLKKTAAAVSIPVYAIGGISPDNFSLVKKSGAAGACIMSSLMRTENPAALAELLTEQWRQQ